MAGVLVEMYKLDLNSSSLTYNVTIEGSFSPKNFSPQSYIIIDSSISIDFKYNDGKVLIIKVSEVDKTLRTCEKIISFLRDQGATRGSTLIAIGGGNIQDLATLSASLYMRGIKWEYYPTTSTAMLDSCIGGKSSINVADSKNLIGNFYPPVKIRCFTDFLNTLNDIDLACGLIEAAKICFAKDSSTFLSFLEILGPNGQEHQKINEDLIFLTLSAKKWFIEVDEFDKKERQLLNFGHTVGHALEIASSFRIPHGIAVGIGCLVEMQLGQHQDSKNGSEFINAIKLLLKPAKSMLQKETKLINYDFFLSAFISDKKHTQEHFRIVTFSTGKLELVEFDKDEAIVKSIYEDLLSILREIGVE